VHFGDELQVRFAAWIICLKLLVLKHMQFHLEGRSSADNRIESMVPEE